MDELCTDAISLYREAGVVDELAGIETALAVTYSTRGDHAKARDLLCDAEQILAGLDSAPWARAMLAYVSGRRAFIENRYRDAEEALHASVPLLQAVGGEVHSSFAYRYIGRLAAVRGDYDASVERDRRCAASGERRRAVCIRQRAAHRPRRVARRPR